jgi:hypothetical protein
MSGLGDDAQFYDMVYIPSALTDMADRLTKLPYATDVAANTGAVIDHLRTAIDMAAKLGPVWHAVERFDSGDGQGEIDVHEALAAYRGEGTQP